MKFSAGLTALALAASCVGGEESPRDPGTKIKHFIVLMLENRSYDHMLGGSGIGEGLTGNETNPWVVADPSQGFVQVRDSAPYVGPCDPGHSIPTTREQAFGDTDADERDDVCMCGFVQQNARRSPECGESSMEFFPPERVPVITKLAEEFVTFDHWFCSMPGNTQPNRVFTNQGTSGGYTNNMWPLGGFPNPNLFDLVTNGSLDWSVYFDLVPGVVYHRTAIQNPRKLHFYSNFERDVMSGNLANYVWIEPSYASRPARPANDQHPVNPVDEGERFIKDVYETLRRSPIWEESALLITYDEHGGFFDHVLTPNNDVPSPDGIPGQPYWFDFQRLGVRVPTLLISPWVPRGYVESRPRGGGANSGPQYDHTSLIKTLRSYWSLGGEAFTEREAWAGDFSHVMDLLSEPRQDTPVTLPDVPEITEEWMEKLISRPPTHLTEDLVMQISGLVQGTGQPLGGPGPKVNWEEVGRTEGEAALWLEKTFAKWQKEQLMQEKEEQA